MLGMPSVFDQSYSNHRLPNGSKIDIRKLVMFCHYSGKIKIKMVDPGTITTKSTPFKSDTINYLGGLSNFEQVVTGKYIVITDENRCLDGRHRVHLAPKHGVKLLPAIEVPEEYVNNFISHLE